MRRGGFTLVEIVITITIVAIIAGVSAKVLMEGLDTYALITNRKDAVQHARVGMDRMVSELILVRSADITYISDTRINFRDINGGATNFKRNVVQNTVDLYRGDDFLAGMIALLDFDFYKENGTQAVWTWDVRRINIELTIQTVGGYGSIPLRTEIFPRNFMYSNFR